ncbi:hypothetical protein BDZ45DRAFT_743132 [Acephala macrosclerotiorum]|nr:hypothetical protein BDZ45DRAFT_743132 [Acephala macrosclerotiorum]
MEITGKYSHMMSLNTTSTIPPDASFLAQSRVPEILFGSIFPALVATIFVLGQFYSRIILLLRYWGGGDTWVLISWITSIIVLTALNCELTRFGSGKHVEAASLASLAPSVTIGFAARLLYQFAVTNTKLGICDFYHRVFQDRRSKIFVWTMTAYITAYPVPYGCNHSSMQSYRG